MTTSLLVRPSTLKELMTQVGCTKAQVWNDAWATRRFPTALPAKTNRRADTWTSWTSTYPRGFVCRQYIAVIATCNARVGFVHRLFLSLQQCYQQAREVRDRGRDASAGGKGVPAPLSRDGGVTILHVLPAVYAPWSRQMYAKGSHAALRKPVRRDVESLKPGVDDTLTALRAAHTALAQQLLRAQSDVLTLQKQRAESDADIAARSAEVAEVVDEGMRPAPVGTVVDCPVVPSSPVGQVQSQLRTVNEEKHALRRSLRKLRADGEVTAGAPLMWRMFTACTSSPHTLHSPHLTLGTTLWAAGMHSVRSLAATVPAPSAYPLYYHATLCTSLRVTRCGSTAGLCLARRAVGAGAVTTPGASPPQASHRGRRN